jgi:hypothetical protein
MATETRSLRAIALDIYDTWPEVNYAAEPYLDAMVNLASIDDTYGQDRASDIARYFLANAGTWRGSDARRIKAELKGML